MRLGLTSAKMRTAVLVVIPLSRGPKCPNLSSMTVLDDMLRLGKQAKEASRRLALVSAADKNMALLAMADALEAASTELKAANALDLGVGRQLGLSSAMLDRLELNDTRIAGMAAGLREVAALPDPVGRILDRRTRPNGLRIEKISSPIGVVVIIYESRPNVTADAASLPAWAGAGDVSPADGTAGCSSAVRPVPAI